MTLRRTTTRIKVGQGIRWYRTRAWTDPDSPWKLGTRLDSGLPSKNSRVLVCTDARPGETVEVGTWSEE